MSGLYVMVSATGDGRSGSDLVWAVADSCFAAGLDGEIVEPVVGSDTFDFEPEDRSCDMCSVSENWFVL